MRPESDLAITHTHTLYNIYLPRPHHPTPFSACAQKRRRRRNCKNNETTKTLLVVNALIDTLLPSQWLSCSRMARGREGGRRKRSRRGGDRHSRSRSSSNTSRNLIHLAKRRDNCLFTQTDKDGGERGAGERLRRRGLFAHGPIGPG